MPNTWIATVHLAGCVLSLTLFGFYSQLYFSTMWSAYKRRRSYPVMVSLTVLYVANVVDAAYRIYCLFVGFIRWPGGPIDFFENGPSIALWLAFYHLACVVASIAADYIILRRLYHIWNRDKLIMILPCLNILLNIAGACLVFTLDIKQGGPNASRSIEHSNHVWKYIILANTLAVNVYITFLITFRLWSMARSVHHAVGRVDHPYARLGGALIESGVIYTVIYAASVICLLAHNVSAKFASAQIILSYIDIRTAGIVASFIILYGNRMGAAQEAQGTSASVVGFAQMQAGPMEFFGGSLAQGRNVHFDEEIFSPSSTRARVNWPMPVGSDSDRR